GAEIDAVDVELEELRFGEFPLEPERQQRFLDLAFERALLGQKKIFRKLLSDCGAALRDATVQDVGEGCASDAVGVDAKMLIKAPVLDSDEGLRYITGHFLQRNGRAGKIAAARERASLHVHNLDRGWPLGDFQ